MFRFFLCFIVPRRFFEETQEREIASICSSRPCGTHISVTSALIHPQLKFQWSIPMCRCAWSHLFQCRAGYGQLKGLPG